MKTTEKNENNEGNTNALGKNAEPLTRDQVLRLSSQTIRQLHKRVSGTRFKMQSSDNAKLSHIRALVQVLQVYSSLLKDHEIEDLEKRIEELEKMRQRE
ncbi:MAG TPA: hypothetical protein PKM50_08055 [Methanoregula sp.]|nr:hypothetical protein [Methanoregula sp.]